MSSITVSYRVVSLPKKILCVPPVHPSFPQTLGNHCLFIVAIVLHFLEYHIVGIIQYIAFSNWLFSFLAIPILDFLCLFMTS